MDIEKVKELLKIIETKNFDDMEGAGMPEFGNYEENISLAKAALFLLDEPVCKTCGGTKVQKYTVSVWGDEDLPMSRPCPDCQPPPAGEFTKETHELTKNIREAVENHYKDPIGFISYATKNLIEACDLIDRLEAEKKERFMPAFVKGVKDDAYDKLIKQLESQLVKRDEAIKYLWNWVDIKDTAGAIKVRAILGDDFKEIVK